MSDIPHNVRTHSPDTLTESTATRTNSPSADARIVDATGKVLAMASLALSAAALGGVLVFAILVPELIQSRAQSAAAIAEQKAEAANVNARVAIDQIQAARLELSKKGIFIQLDDHQ